MICQVFVTKWRWIILEANIEKEKRGKPQIVSAIEIIDRIGFMKSLPFQMGSINQKFRNAHPLVLNNIVPKNIPQYFGSFF